ncbi:hypothetical protein NA78x_002882 [Anatilimnocola sp. NA78]|uniref:hypothetical protein n=1 Tax=Anatilimnocola sp. NA78 TaxID=3415683 RepID=UPI003CE553E2
MARALKLLFTAAVLIITFAVGGCATDSGTLTWNPFRSSGGGGGGHSSCGPGCNH